MLLRKTVDIVTWFFLVITLESYLQKNLCYNKTFSGIICSHLQRKVADLRFAVTPVTGACVNLCICMTHINLAASKNISPAIFQ